MKTVVSLFVAFVAATAAADFEKIPYVCRCSCFNPRAQYVRVRVPGGGYGYELMHKPMFNPDRRLLTDFLLTGVTDPQFCRTIRNLACTGVAGEDWQTGYQTNGWLGNCRWDINPYPVDPGR